MPAKKEKRKRKKIIVPRTIFSAFIDYTQAVTEFSTSYFTTLLLYYSLIKP